jgi:PAS domain S-box-containing protein
MSFKSFARYFLIVFTTMVLIGGSILVQRYVYRLVDPSSMELLTLEKNLPVVTLAGLTVINLLWILSVLTLLSARKRSAERAEEATRDLKKFKQAVDGVSDQVIIADKDGVITYTNAATSGITGYNEKEMIGNRPSLWGGQMSKEYYRNFWKTIKEDKKPFWGELINKRKSGEIYEAEIHVTPILDEQGELVFFVGIERDMSKFRAIEKMKTEFIALASHQLRTPLSAIKWFSEMLLDGDAGKLTKMQEKYVSKINVANEREIQIVNALLNVSRIESGKIVVVAKPTNLKGLVESTLGDYKVNMVGENKKFTYTIDKGVPSINIDPDLIKHVYNNLLSNAVNYTPEGGSVSVKVYVKGNKVISEITDNGIGIPKAEQARLFEKFFRTSNALKKNTEGTGLGLYLTKTIVESSGGNIWFTSSEGKGTTFTFTLPIKALKHSGRM